MANLRIIAFSPASLDSIQVINLHSRSSNTQPLLFGSYGKVLSQRTANPPFNSGINLPSQTEWKS